MKTTTQSAGLFLYQDGTSPLHTLHPLAKLFAAFLLCAVCFVSQNCIFVAALILLNFSFAIIGGASRTALRVIASLGKLAALLFVVQVLFVREGNPVITTPLIITDRGIIFSLLFVLRLIAISLPLVICIAVTKSEDISNTLVLNLRLPVPYAFAITTALRFIPLFASEMNGIMEAQMSRGVDFQTRNFFKKIRLMLPLCVPLLVSSVRKIENASLSADLRGFTLRSRSSIRQAYRWAGRDSLVLAGGAVLCILAIAINYYAT